MSCADISLKYINNYIVDVAAWFLWGAHKEIDSGVYMYYAHMRPCRSRYHLDFIYLLTVPDCSLAPRKV